MELVLSKTGGLEISREGWEWLLNNGFDPYEEFDCDNYPGEFRFNHEYYSDDLNVLYEYNDMKERYKEDGYTFPYNDFKDYLYGGGKSYYLDIPRNHILLVRMVKELGSIANPVHKFIRPIMRQDNLRIVEIPDDVQYIIEEFDSGGEIVRERHRTWGIKE